MIGGRWRRRPGVKGFLQWTTGGRRGASEGLQRCLGGLTVDGCPVFGGPSAQSPAVGPLRCGTPASRCRQTLAGPVPNHSCPSFWRRTLAKNTTTISFSPPALRRMCISPGTCGCARPVPCVVSSSHLHRAAALPSGLGVWALSWVPKPMDVTVCGVCGFPYGTECIRPHASVREREGDFMNHASLSTRPPAVLPPPGPVPVPVPSRARLPASDICMASFSKLCFLLLSSFILVFPSLTCSIFLDLFLSLFSRLASSFELGRFSHSFTPHRVTIFLPFFSNHSNLNLVDRISNRILQLSKQ